MEQASHNLRAPQAMNFFYFFLRRPQAMNILPLLYTRNTQVIMVFAPLKKDRRL